MLFSATFTDDIIELINKFFDKIEAFTIQKEALKLKGVKLFKIRTLPELKQDLIKEVYEAFDMFQTMIFANKKQDVERLQAELQKKGISAEKLIGGIEQKERDQIIDRFRKTEITSLISTNVLARGIDVPEVDLVINYDVPFYSDYGFRIADTANFLHRVGRTGRFGTDSVSLTIYTDDTDSDMLTQIQQFYDIEIKEIESVWDLKIILDEMRGNAAN